MNVNVRTVQYRDGQVASDTTQRVNAPTQWDALIKAGFVPADAEESPNGDILVTIRDPFTGAVDAEVSATAPWWLNEPLRPLSDLYRKKDPEATITNYPYGDAPDDDELERRMEDEGNRLQVPVGPRYEAGDLIVTDIGGRTEVHLVHAVRSNIKNGEPGWIGAPVGSTIPDVAWGYDRQVREVYRQV